MKDSFSLANITAQTPETNRGIYKYTEILTRKLASKAGKANLVAGAVFDRINPKRVGPGRIAVPSHLYRVVYSGNSEKYAFLIPNVRENLGKKPSKYRVSIEELEKLTGFKF
jgi:endonuclease G